MLRSTSAPAHASTVEPHADEIADGAFDRTGGDVEVLSRPAELVVAGQFATREKLA
jgi:hypothetical protein